ncbi:hypothetical protein SKDZ_12G4860 [Saccharomyces kudriavzevii ZP591]|nr:hypothetical protein SKDZ_12G4860 [Saccharomyces kudriavzevii ZP591]
MKDTEFEDEEKLLSSEQVASYRIVLPKKVFRNRFTWSCYEIYRSLTFRIWLLLWLSLIAWWEISAVWIYPLIAFVLLFLGVISLPAIQISCGKCAISKQLIQFSKEIIENTPGTHADDWDAIAVNLNSYMYENKLWKTEYLIFDGSHCQEAFRTTILKPFSLKKDDDAKLKSFGDSVPYIEKALEFYFAEVNKEWEPSLSTTNSTDAQLPREIYRFKLTWLFKRIFRLRSLLLAFFHSVFIFAKWNWGLLFRVLYLGGIFFIMVMQDFQNIVDAWMKMEHKKQFLSTIINEQDIGAKGWDKVAKRMNRYLFEQKAWRNEEYFFDGIDCQRFFERNFVSLLSCKNSISFKSLDVELWPYIRQVQSSCSDGHLV